MTSIEEKTADGTVNAATTSVIDPQDVLQRIATISQEIDQLEFRDITVDEYLAAGVKRSISETWNYLAEECTGGAISRMNEITTLIDRSSNGDWDQVQQWLILAVRTWESIFDRVGNLSILGFDGMRERLIEAIQNLTLDGTCRQLFVLFHSPNYTVNCLDVFSVNCGKMQALYERLRDGQGSHVEEELEDGYEGEDCDE